MNGSLVEQAYRAGDGYARALWGEVADLLRRGYSPALPPLQAIGYRELCDLAIHGGDLTETAREIALKTRHLAKRQMTWFRRMPIEWVRPGKLSSTLVCAKKFLQTRA